MMPLPDFSDTSEPQGLQKVAPLAASFKPIRPLDPNGVDVFGELPQMQKAYTMARTLGLARNTNAGEAGYAILPNGHDTPITTADGLRLKLRVPANALAIVHTHPLSAHATPGPEDANSQFPNYVFSGDKLYATVPGEKSFNEYNISDWNSPALTGLHGIAGQRK